MKTKNRPFEGILGNTVELRILERLLASPDAEFNVSELGTMAGVHRDSASKVIEKFLRWNILVRKSRGKMDFFRLNTEEPLVTSVNALNDSIIMQMFPEVEETLMEMTFDALDPVRSRERGGPFVTTTVVSEPMVPPLGTNRTPLGTAPTRTW